MPSWPRTLALAPSPPHHRLGLRSLAESDWLVAGDDLAAQLTLKRGLLERQHADVFGAERDSELAGDEVAATVADWLARHRPDATRPDAERSASDDDLHPLDAAARAIAEDLCVLEQRDGAWVLTAASLCFPSRWRLADKLGTTITALHGPVPHYADEVAAGVERFLDRLRPGPISWRRNWSLHRHDVLFEPTAPAGPPVAPERLWLRSEFQTLRALPDTGAVLFTIRTQQCPLTDVDHDTCRALASVLADFDASLVRYKAGDFDVAEAVGWLQSR